MKRNPSSTRSRMEELNKKYARPQLTPTDALQWRDELEEIYGEKIIPELNYEDLNAEELFARALYSALSEQLAEISPKIGKLDKRMWGHMKVEKKSSGRLANVIFLTLKILSLIWLGFWLLYTISNPTGDTVVLFLILGVCPFLVITLAEVYYWYVAGIIEFDDIFQVFKERTVGLLKSK